MLHRLFILLTAIIGLAACSSGANFSSRGAPDVTRSYTLADFTFAAPADLTVSESENYYPFADVVWRGDPRDARVPQIAAMFETAAQRTTPALTGDVPVAVSVRLVRFHGVTDRTRYSVGGNYNIVFDLIVRDARTGTVIEPARRVTANLDAPGGSRAVALEQSGQTQKVRVVNFLAEVLFAELS
ncbi:DUF6778 family protein [Cognatiyoonia sp. IB215446]|uniref:DUF6778 family protein n=1 Tax=Cognatiyoonia sp. IB215446 TaxID=3097355 RepID=UPI002A0E765C|nr:DUF6778 family protein [Cognatiyoonia sp. IB215446]MDX8349712.1 DUF6778 family protein [Cognatiyoonia sp. IB215446]